MFFVNDGEKPMKNLVRIILPTSVPLMLMLFYSPAGAISGTGGGEGIIPSADTQASSQATPSPDSSLRVGREQFMKNCSGCHGEKAQGFAGPNLTDKFWIHGYGIKGLCTTISDGVPATGMIGWSVVYTPQEIRDIAGYILTLQGTNPPKAKKPEGTLHEGPGK